MGHQLNQWLKGLLGTGAVTGALFLACSVYVDRRYADRIAGPADVPSAPVAVVFGAGLAPNSEPSVVLAERLDMAIALYRAHKVSKLLVSGDNSERYHDETGVMRRYALEQGLPPGDVLSDRAGVSTYDTCLRARQVFGVERAILVTQRFHLPRALYIANSVGIDASGVPADGQRPQDDLTYAARELLSRPWAFALVLLRPAASAEPPKAH